MTKWRFCRFSLLACCLVGWLVACSVVAMPVSAKERQWLKGTWRDIQAVTVNNGTVSLPTGLGVYINLPLNDATEVVTIDGPNGLQYIATADRHLVGVIVNDPLDFFVDGSRLYIPGDKKGKEYKLTIVKVIRLAQ